MRSPTNLRSGPHLKGGEVQRVGTIIVLEPGRQICSDRKLLSNNFQELLIKAE